jgi:hypothetical protein
MQQSMHGSTGVLKNQNLLGTERNMAHMKNTVDISPGHQRLFQDHAGRCILLHKAGIAVSFWLGKDNAVRVVERIEGIDFKETGTQLKRDGWKCIGPGMAYAWLFKKNDR